MKNFLQKFLILLTTNTIFFSMNFVFADFEPGQTLDPNCLPTDPTCRVSFSANNINSGILGVGFGGTGTSSFNTGEFLIGNNNSSILSTNGLTWDDVNKSLKIGYVNSGVNPELEIQGNNAEVFITSLDDYNTGEDQSLIFRGKYTSAGNFGTFGSVNVAKENISDGDLRSTMSFKVRNGTDGIFEWAKVTSNGLVGLKGITDPQNFLHIKSRYFGGSQYNGALRIENHTSTNFGMFDHIVGGLTLRNNGIYNQSGTVTPKSTTYSQITLGNGVIDFYNNDGLTVDAPFTPTSILTLGTNGMVVNGLAKRFQADFSNATASNRLAFQTYISNGNSIVNSIPNGSGTVGGFRAYNNSDMTNGNYFSFQTEASVGVLDLAKQGTGVSIPLSFRIDGSEKMRLDNTGSLNIGYSSSLLSGQTGSSTSLTISNIDIGGNASVVMKAFSTNANISSNLDLGRSRNNTKGVNTTTINGDYLGTLAFSGVNTGNSPIAGASILGVQTGLSGASYIPADLIFQTSNGVVTPTERMRILSTGKLSVGYADSVYPDVTAEFKDNFYTTSSTGNPIIGLTRIGGTRGGVFSTMTNGVGLGEYRFDGTYNSTGSTKTGALIGAVATGTWSSTASPSDIVFFTSPTSGAIVEKARITSGNTYFGTVDGANFQIIDQASFAQNVGGSISFAGKHNSSGALAGFARILGIKENATEGNFAGALVFQTRVAGGSQAEYMRISSGGDVLIGSSSNTVSPGKLRVYQSNASNPALTLEKTIGTTTNQIIFYNTNGAVGSISTNGSTTSYNTSSDYRLKKDVELMKGGIEKILKLKPVTYRWNSDNSHGEGFIAHELQEVFPEAVTGNKDEVDENGNPIYQGIDTAFLTGAIVSSIQELNSKFENLKLGLNTDLINQTQITSLDGVALLNKDVLFINSNTVLSEKSEIVLCKNKENILLTLPEASKMKGREIKIKLLENSQVMINSLNNELIEGEDFIYLQNKYENINLISDGESWYKI